MNHAIAMGNELHDALPLTGASLASCSISMTTGGAAPSSSALKHGNRVYRFKSLGRIVIDPFWSWSGPDRSYFFFGPDLAITSLEGCGPIRPSTSRRRPTGYFSLLLFVPCLIICLQAEKAKAQRPAKQLGLTEETAQQSHGQAVSHVRQNM